MSTDLLNENNKNIASQKNDDNKRLGGFSFDRLLGITILTILLIGIALYLDRLSTFSRNIEYETGGFCQVDGICGWRTATYEWTETGQVTECESTGTTSNINYRRLCMDNNLTADCKTMNAGNCYVAFIILSSIANVFLLTLLVPLCCNKRKSIYTKCTNRFNEGGLRNVLQITYLMNTLFLFLSAFIWLVMGLCDDALPMYSEIFHYDSMNIFSYSTGCIIVCLVANLVAFGAVTWCWGDHRYYEKVELSGKRYVKTEYGNSSNDDINYFQTTND
eukprot:176320_1